MAVVVQTHGRCPHRRRHVHPQPDHRRPLGDRRSRVRGVSARPWSVARSRPIVGSSARSPAKFQCATSRTRRSVTCPRRPAASSSVAVEEAMRRAPCMSDEELQALRGRSARSRETLRPAAGHRVGRRSALEPHPASAEPSGDGVVEQGHAGRAAARSRPLLHVMSIFGGQR